jgi:hypothetical protein
VIVTSKVIPIESQLASLEPKSEDKEFHINRQ